MKTIKTILYNPVRQHVRDEINHTMSWDFMKLIRINVEAGVSSGPKRLGEQIFWQIRTPLASKLY
jgi:hypothetical protein